jgi:hypothetical protein
VRVTASFSRRIDWRTVGRIIDRVCSDELGPARLDGLVEIGVYEVSWRAGHRYLRLVCDHRHGRVAWAPTATARPPPPTASFELGTERSAASSNLDGT